MLHGVLVVDKPAGLTSHDVVAAVRRAVGVSRIGHTGTLDPIATGVLPLVIGRATRLARFLASTDKAYEAVIALGAISDTYDAQGRLVTTPGDWRPPTRAVIERALDVFRGSYLQAPPPFSAKKIGGVRAYALARRREPVQPPPVTVSVHRLELRWLEERRLAVRIDCSAGFYVRSFAHELGRHLGCGAYVTALRRLQSGGFLDADAMPLERVQSDPQAAIGRLVPLDRLLPDLPEARLTVEGARRVAHGQDLQPAHLMAPLSRPATSRGPRACVRLVNSAGKLVGIAASMESGAALHPVVVLV